MDEEPEREDFLAIVVNGGDETKIAVMWPTGTVLPLSTVIGG